MCRDASPMATRRLIHLCQYAEEESVQCKAAQTILDRAWGKAPQAVTLKGDADDPIQFVFSVVTERIGGGSHAPHPPAVIEVHPTQTTLPEVTTSSSESSNGHARVQSGETPLRKRREGEE
jgi:hypothetical protein